MSRRLTRLLVAALVLSCALAVAQETAPVSSLPQLTKEQALELDNALLQFEITRLRIQILVQSLQRPGFTFDVGTKTYVVQPPPVKETP